MAFLHRQKTDRMRARCDEIQKMENVEDYLNLHPLTIIEAKRLYYKYSKDWDENRLPTPHLQQRQGKPLLLAIVRLLSTTESASSVGNTLSTEHASSVKNTPSSGALETLLAVSTSTEVLPHIKKLAFTPLVPAPASRPPYPPWASLLVPASASSAPCLPMPSTPSVPALALSVSCPTSA